MTQGILFQEEMCGPAVLNKVEEAIAAGSSSATLIEWSGFPVGAIEQAISGFISRGWAWDGSALQRNGWIAWFRSQGVLAPPIIQWRPIKRS